MPARPNQGGSPGTWGAELNAWLDVEHNSDGTHKIPKTYQVKAFDDSEVILVGDAATVFCVPPEIDGYNLVDADAYVTTVSSSGLPTVQIRRTRAGANVDMLTTKITIDASEVTSFTAATAAVINTANDDVSIGDLISIDVDVAGTGAKGLGIILKFSL